MKHLWLLLLLAGCAPEAPKPPAAKPKAAAPENIYPVYGIAVANGGLLLTDPKTKVARLAGFGMRQSLIIAIVSRSLGAVTEGQDAACGKGFARWGGDDALTLWFADGALTGWTLTGWTLTGWTRTGGPPRIGIGPGLTAAKLMSDGATCG